MLLQVAGKVADDMFELTGHSSKARKLMMKYCIGALEGAVVTDMAIPEDTEEEAQTENVTSAPDPQSASKCFPYFPKLW